MVPESSCFTTFSLHQNVRNLYLLQRVLFFIFSERSNLCIDLKWEDLSHEYPPEYRNSQRLIAISNELANSVWNRTQPQLQFKDIHNITPMGFGTAGLWLPVRINKAFVCSQYQPGQFFKPHYDGVYVNDHKEASIFTVTLYLNDNFKGGSVKFYRSLQDPTVLFSYSPKQGDALIFNHDVCHEGEAISTGIKYIMRTAIMFRYYFYSGNLFFELYYVDKCPIFKTKINLGNQIQFGRKCKKNFKSLKTFLIKMTHKKLQTHT